MANDANNKRTYAFATLETYVKEFKIFIDTCSLLHTAGTKFWENIIPLLKKYGTSIIIPSKSIEELEKHSKNEKDFDLATNSKNTLKKVKQLMGAGFVEIRGEKTDNFADNVFQVVFTKHRITHKLLLITQDNNLAQDILSLNESKSVKAYPVKVRKINQYGFLSKFPWDKNNNNKDEYVRIPIVTESNKKAQELRNTIKTNKDSKKRCVFITWGNNIQKPYDTISQNTTSRNNFKLYESVTTLADIPMPITHIPCERDTVYAQQSPIRLLKKIASGGEGTIYETDTSFVAKIYKRENITIRKYEKIKLMLSKQISHKGICLPTAILHNANKEFIGYLMPKANGKELQKSIFIKPLLIKNFPDWKKRDTVELCITILEKIKFLHENNIIMGDINPSNILVVSPKEVHFVDTDSYQVEDFPCPVGTINYTAPEIQRKTFSDFLRTIGNENFAVATLLFMIMLPGKPPYSQQGGEDPIANIINMDFSYPLGENSNKKTPDGPWRYIWSHLTYDLKKAFYNTFRKGGENSTENTRLSVTNWLDIFEDYLKLLDNGKLEKQDEMSNELFPTRYKKNSNLSYIICQYCNNEVVETQSQNGICRECLSKGEVYKCKKCGKEIFYSNYQRYVKQNKRYDTCQECYNKGISPKIMQSCIDCKINFPITYNEYDYFESKGFSIPKRCPACRDAKKNEMKNNSSQNNTGSFCFITTTVCDYLGKSDDCYELETLRHYRDTWLQNQPDGLQLITEYYRKAPLLVSLLINSQYYDSYCELLWTKYIQPCLKLINEKKFEECRNLYKDMVYFLEAKLCVK